MLGSDACSQTDVVKVISPVLDTNRDSMYKYTEKRGTCTYTLGRQTNRDSMYTYRKKTTTSKGTCTYTLDIQTNKDSMYK